MNNRMRSIDAIHFVETRHPSASTSLVEHGIDKLPPSRPNHFDHVRCNLAIHTLALIWRAIIARDHDTTRTARSPAQRTLRRAPRPQWAMHGMPTSKPVPRSRWQINALPTFGNDLLTTDARTATRLYSVQANTQALFCPRILRTFTREVQAEYCQRNAIS